ncbi:arginase [Hwanghaeella grinnelliae]|uniref:Arginase n=1 Tax=Hwanghaeella grinnelliae TaxID=2500179 RepID=A0A3S2W4D2_9PROT|nr:arginase family protein [Hwanghaeella grinnelliae]RVU36196.1 arginase [Hwanghaeella grinnelliae]
MSDTESGGKPSIAGVFGPSGTVETFLGLPKVATSDLEASGAKAAVLGVPCATPYAATGLYAAKAPKAMRESAAIEAAATHHFDFDRMAPAVPLGPDGKPLIVDCGDLDYDAEDHAANRARISKAVSDILAAGAVPIVLGGDDSSGIPILQGYADDAAENGPLTVLQIDAHIDWRDEVNGERFGLSSPMRRASEMEWVTGMVQVGARAVGSARPSDYEDAVAWGVNFITAAMLHRDGIRAVVDAIPDGSRVFVNFDLDGLDPSVAPGVIGPSPGGLFMHQALAILNGVAEKARIAGFCLVEFAPDLDRDGQSAHCAYRLSALAAAIAAEGALQAAS